MNPIEQIAAACGGTISNVMALPDGSGCCTMSMPLPKDHWSCKDPEVFGVPPMPLRLGANEKILILRGEDAKAMQRVLRARALLSGKPSPQPMMRNDLDALIIAAGKYAYRAATMNGKEPDLDPDALLQNLCVGMTGYNTETGLSSDEWANPPQKP